MLASVLGGLEDRYRNAIATVRAEPGLADLPILIHGYDRALPSGFPGDDRNPIYADRDQWLGAPMHAHGIEDHRAARGHHRRADRRIVCHARAVGR